MAGDHTVILSTHILPEVSQTCQRVVIINRGKVVAVDSPDNLTARLQGSQSLYLQIDTAGVDPVATLLGIAGVTSVSAADHLDGLSGFQLELAQGDDVRREVARTVVMSGWGLLELRAQQMSLEDVFLQLTTEETADEPTEKTSNASTSDSGPATTEEHIDG